MKKVEKVSIGRYAFTLEEDACRELAGYIGELKKHYCGSPDCEEIVDAFENRMAELLMERHQGESIITIADIDAIKARIGAPESFGDTRNCSDENRADAENEKKDAEKDEWWKNDSKKKMFRPRSGRFIGGVAAAMANRFGMDVTLMRLLWCLAAIAGIIISDEAWDGAFPIVFLAYICLWICIPSATEHQEIMNAGNETQRNAFWKTTGGIIRILFGGILALVGIAGIAAGVTSLCGISILDMSNLWDEIAEEMVLDIHPGINALSSGLFVKILICLCYFIPFLVFLYEGIKICFEFKSSKWHPGLILSLIWFASIIAAGIAIAAAFIPTLSI